MGSVVRFVKITDEENPFFPKAENIAKQLEKEICNIKAEYMTPMGSSISLVSACFLGKADPNADEDEDLFYRKHKIEYQFMLFFE